MSDGSGNNKELPPWLIAFREKFIDTGKVAPRFYEYLLEAYRLEEFGRRERGAVSREEAEAMLRKGTEFVAMAEQLLCEPGGEDG